MYINFYQPHLKYGLTIVPRILYTNYSRSILQYAEKLTTLQSQKLCIIIPE